MNSRMDALLESSSAGNFLEAVYARSRADSDDLALDLANLHNEGLVDVVAAFANLKNKSPNGPNFFLTRNVFEKTLPHLNAPVSSVMSCVLQLFRDAGQDMMAGAIIEGFVGFCEKEPSRPREALKEIEVNPGAFADLLTATLCAGSRLDNPYYLAETIRFAEDKNIELRRRAVYAVGRINWPEGIVSDSAFTALERSAATETDDLILGGIVKSAFALWKRDKTQEGRAVALVASALAKGDEYTLHAASEIFGLHTNELPASLSDALLPQLLRVKPTNKGTLNMIDYGISHLLKGSNPEQAIRFLENFLLAHPDTLTLNTFDSAAGEIRVSKTLLSKVLTRWLMRGDRVLCEGLHSIISAHHGDNLKLEIDPVELEPPTYVRTVFIARKALGYLLFQPVSAASILISLMRLAPNDQTLNALGSLLFNPVLMNFTGSAREYVVQQSGLETGKVKATIDAVINSIDDYLNVLRSVGNLPALHPSESQREAQHRHLSRKMAESWKEAQAHSVLMNLFSKSVLLYGRTSIDYIFDTPDGPPRRMATPLTNHGTEIEFARMENIDPHELNYMIRVFMVERFRT